MTDESEKPAPESGGLYVGWEELNGIVAPRLGRDRFRALIKLKQKEAGFPPFREEWGGFYRPKVQAWLDSDNGLGADRVTSHVDHDQEDGPETFDAAPGKKTRPQNRPSQPAVLVREAGVPRPDGVSRHLHSVATGRDG